MTKEEVREAYADFITNFDWNIYLTQTFKGSNVEKMKLRYNNFGGSKTSEFKNGRRDGLNASQAVWTTMHKRFGASRSFIAVEPNRYDGIHLHGLFSIPGVDAAGAQAIKDYQTKVFGFVNSTKNMILETINPNVSMYCSKYVTKGNEYNFFGRSGWWLKK